MRKILKRIRQLILAIVAVYVSFSYFGAVVYLFFEPNVSRIELLKFLFELSLWITVPIVILLVLLRAWRMTLGSLVLVALFLGLYVPLLINRTPIIEANASQFKIMTFNTLTTSEGLVDAILSADADIVALQELSRAGSQAVSELEELYPYQALHPQMDEFKGQGILSRFPILQDEYWEYPDVPHTLGHQRVEIDYNGVLLVVYNTHPWPPLAWKTGFNDESHRLVLADIAERTFAEEQPLLLVGDFNMTSVFEEYDLLSSRFIDSFRVAGDGMGYTFPNDKYRPLSRLIRLDYIWHSNHFLSIDSTVWRDHGQSDHSPVVSTLMLQSNFSDTDN